MGSCPPEHLQEGLCSAVTGLNSILKGLRILQVVKGEKKLLHEHTSQIKWILINLAYWLRTDRLSWLSFAPGINLPSWDHKSGRDQSRGMKYS